MIHVNFQLQKTKAKKSSTSTSTFKCNKKKGNLLPAHPFCLPALILVRSVGGDNLAVQEPGQGGGGVAEDLEKRFKEDWVKWCEWGRRRKWPNTNYPKPLRSPQVLYYKSAQCIRGGFDWRASWARLISNKHTPPFDTLVTGLTGTGTFKMVYPSQNLQRDLRAGVR